jgi:curved DNA-binding protein CbpA
MFRCRIPIPRVAFVAAAAWPCPARCDPRRFVSAAHHRPGKCPFLTLGLEKNATRIEVKNKYKHLAKTEHPDAGGSEERFKEVNEAYQACTQILDEREFDLKYGRAYAGNGTGRKADEGPKHTREEHSQEHHQQTRYDSNDGFNEEQEAVRHPRTDAERRERLCELFNTAKDPATIDELLVHCLQSRVFDQVDLGEPLLRALSRYHRGMPLGTDHVKRCFAAIDRWENWHHKSAPQSYYHPLLVIYSDFQEGATDMSDITEGVTAILEEIERKGHLPDDWSVSLANRVFRTSPIAWKKKASFPPRTALPPPFSDLSYVSNERV